MHLKANDLSRAARALLSESISDNGVVSELGLKQTLFEVGSVSSRDTVVMLSADEARDLIGHAGRVIEVERDELPVLKVTQDPNDPNTIMVAAGGGLEKVRKALSAGQVVIPLQIGFTGSPSRPDDGVWSVMTNPPLYLRSGSVTVDMPEPPVSAALLGIEAQTARHLGAAMDAISAVTSGTLRHPEVSDDPVGNKAEELATKHLDTLYLSSSDEVFSRALRVTNSYKSDRQNALDAERLLSIARRPTFA